MQYPTPLNEDGHDDTCHPNAPVQVDSNRTRAWRSARPGTRFAIHYLEMVCVMVLGMILFHPLWMASTARAGEDSMLRSVEVDTLMMATSMSIPMLLWMLLRSHSLTSAAEMSGAMHVGFVVLYPFSWMGVMSDAAVELLGHALMLVFMLGSMLRRRAEFGGRCSTPPRAASPDQSPTCGDQPA